MDENRNDWNNERPSGRQGGRPPRQSRGRRGFRRGFRRRECYFCTEKVDKIEYKDAQMLRRFLSDRGKIKPRRRTGTCARHQRQLSQAIKRARHLALLPFTSEHSRGA